MPNYSIINPYPVILNQVGGGLNGGKVFIGVADQDPETNPTPVYWDDAGSDVAAQPLPTIGGYIVRAGTPAQVYGPVTYSIRVRDRFGAQVFYNESANSPLVGFILELASAGGASKVGFKQTGTGSVLRNVNDKLLELPATTADFGASGGAGDATTDLQEAIDSLDQGGMLNLNRGSGYSVGTLSISKSIRIGSNGTAENNCQIKARFGTGPLLQVDTAPGFRLSDVSFIAGVTRTALDGYISLHKVYRGAVRDFRMDGHSVGFDLNDVSAYTIADGTFAFPLPNAVLAGTCSVRVGKTAYVGTLDLDNLYLTSQQPEDVYDDSYQPEAGVQLYHSDNITMKSPFMAYQGTAIAAVPGAGQFVTNADILAPTLDYARRQLLLSPQGGAISHWTIVGGLMAFSHLPGGLCIDATLGEVSDITVIGTKIINHRSGFLPDADVTNPANDAAGIGVLITGSGANVPKGIRLIGTPLSNCTLAVKIDAGEGIIIDGADFGANGDYCPASAQGLEIAAGVKGRLRNSRFKGVATPFVNHAPSTFLMDEWQDYTPVLTAQTGALVAYTAAGRFRTIANRVEFRITATITDNGTAAVNLRYTLPPIPAVVGTLEGYGRTDVSGKSVQSQDFGTTQGIAWDATNTYPGGVGTIRIAGSYEIVEP